MAPLLRVCLDIVGLEVTLLGQAAILLITGVMGKRWLTGQGARAAEGQERTGERPIEASNLVKFCFLVGDFFPVWGLYILYSSTDVLLHEAGMCTNGSFPKKHLIMLMLMLMLSLLLMLILLLLKR